MLSNEDKSTEAESDQVKAVHLNFHISKNSVATKPSIQALMGRTSTRNPRLTILCLTSVVFVFLSLLCMQHTYRMDAESLCHSNIS